MFVRAGDLDVHVQLSGAPDAPPLLMLHSIGTSLHVWDAPAELLAAHYRLIRIDQRGHGLTTVTPGPTTIDTLADDAVAVLDALGIDAAHVAGISLGGMVAQAVAARAPDRALSLIAVDTALAIPPPQSWHDRAAAIRAGGMAVIVDAVIPRWVTPDFLGEPATAGLRQMLLRTDPEGYAAAAEAIAGADLTAATAALRLPALVIVGDRDVATPVGAAEAIRDAIPGALIEIIANAAHISTVERPADVAGAISRFLAAIPHRTKQNMDAP
jgi:3-oxoadipate enol-lactonase